MVSVVNGPEEEWDKRLYLTGEVDKTLEKRMQLLVQRSFDSVEARTKPGCAKAGVVSFVRTRKVGKKGTLVLVAKIGAGIGIGLGVGSLITPIGWAGLLITVGGITAGKAIDKIYTEFKKSERKKQILPLLDRLVEQAPKDENLKKPQLAEAFLKVFMRDSQDKFPAELKKIGHAKVDYTKPGKYHNKPSKKIHTLARFKSKMNLENYIMMGPMPIMWSDDEQMDDHEIVSLRCRRIDLYNKWIQAYVKRISDILIEDLKKLKKDEKGIYNMVENMVRANEYHVSCPNNCCFGPAESDLQWVGANSELDDSISNFDMNEIVNTARTKVQPPKVIRMNDSEQLELAEDKSEVIEYAKEAGPEVLGFSKDMALNTGGGALALMGQVGAGLGAYAFPAIGEILGVAIGEATNTLKTNYPLQGRVGDIRKLLHSQGLEEIDQEIKKAANKGGGDALFRALRKVNGQYLKRISERQEKFKSFIDQVDKREAKRLHSCEEAVTLLRYYFKLIKYYEKAAIHLCLVSKGVQLITDDVMKRANRGF